MEAYKEITSIEEALEIRNNLELELQKLNDEIFNETENSKTEEFNKHYQEIQTRFNEVVNYLVNNHYKEPVEQDSVVNRASLYLWFIMIPLIIITLYPIFNTIQLKIMIAFISMEKVYSMDSTRQIIVLICSFLIMPVLLCALNLTMLACTKNSDNKKVLNILSLVFFISLGISFVISFVMNIIIAFIGK